MYHCVLVLYFNQVNPFLLNLIVSFCHFCSFQSQTRRLFYFSRRLFPSDICKACWMFFRFEVKPLPLQKTACAFSHIYGCFIYFSKVLGVWLRFLQNSCASLSNYKLLLTFKFICRAVSVVLDQVNIWWKSYVLKDHIYLSMTKMQTLHAMMAGLARPMLFQMMSDSSSDLHCKSQSTLRVQVKNDLNILFFF